MAGYDLEVRTTWPDGRYVYGHVYDSKDMAMQVAHDIIADGTKAGLKIVTVTGPRGRVWFKAQISAQHGAALLVTDKRNGAVVGEGYEDGRGA